jgi:hypothetical protein
MFLVIIILYQGCIQKALKPFNDAAFRILCYNFPGMQDTRADVDKILSDEDYYKVKAIFVRIAADEGKLTKYLLHGDTGVHNFVFHEEELKGVIDPSPMVGPMLYDFTYAFCSSPDDLNLETLLAAFALLHHEPIERTKLIAEVIFQLYCRIGICIRVHPHDLEDYLKAWDYWKVLLPSEI